MTYDVNAIREKMLKLNGGTKKNGSTDKKDRPKITWWKPSIGTADVRFLPYDDGKGQPFQEVSYYNSSKLSENRVIAPFQWDLKDPIQELMIKLRKNRQDDATWKLMRQLQARESYYAPLIVRGQEDKGVQIWEMSQKVLNQIYTKLSHPDYAEEYLFDPKEGFDFSVTATDSGREYNGYPIKELTIDVRRKSSPLAKTQKERDDIIASIPNLGDYFKSYTPSEERVNDMVVNFLSGDNSTNEGREVGVEETDEDRVEEADTKISEAFADL